MYLHLLLLTDKCQLRVNCSQWWRDALLLLRLSNAQIPVEFPGLYPQVKNPFAHCIDFPINSDEITGQIIANSAQLGLLRVVSVPARARSIKLGPEVKDRDVDSDSTDKEVGIAAKIADIDR